jgi:HAE1 family hydrophobic/amphiphilic exporter-1
MIRYFAEHPTAANLCMLACIIGGLVTLPNLQRETFPRFSAIELEIRLPYPGASALDIEEAICQRVEDALDAVNNVAELRCEARESIAIITAKMSEDADFGAFNRDIEQAVNGIDDFPEDVESAVYQEVGATDMVMAMLVSGEMSPQALKAHCQDIKDRLQLEGIELVEISGFSEHQLRVELSPAALHGHGLSVQQVAQLIERQNVDLPAGSVDGEERDWLIRVQAQQRQPEDLLDLVLLADESGGELRLGDVATVRNTFANADTRITLGGQRAGMLTIRKTRTQDTLRIANTVKAFVADERVRSPQVALEVIQDQSGPLADRLDMLLRNGWQGLLLVFATLWLFFNLRVSFWVTMGLPTAFLAGFFFLPILGISINMLSMVGLLLALGLIMDDAIVIAENIAAHRERGASASDAAVNGVCEVRNGVLSSFVTTICVLGPLVDIDGQLGKVLQVVPFILILVLSMSMIEAFVILPSHLGHALATHNQAAQNRLRRGFTRAFDFLRVRVYGSVLDGVLRIRYIFVGAVVGLFIVSVAMMVSGRLPMSSFPELEGDVMVARLLLPGGTPAARTDAIVARMMAGLEKLEATHGPSQAGGKLLRSSHIFYGVNADAGEQGPHLATITVDLLPAERRVGRMDDFVRDWREMTGPVPDIIHLSIGEPVFGPSGRPIEIRVAGPELPELKAAVGELRNWFADYDGVFNLTDDLRPGKPELQLRIRDGALGLGLDAATIAAQLRAAFHGISADTVQRGRERYDVNVRMDANARDTLGDLEAFYFSLSDGSQVPLASVAEIVHTRGWARIARIDGARTVTLLGDIDVGRANNRLLTSALQSEFLPGFREAYPELRLSIAGEPAEAALTMGSIGRAGMVGMLGIFILLSVQFRSYLQPLVVMAAIPMASIGVIWGHLIMGQDFSMPSMLGFAALCGVVVNDSILLVLFLKAQHKPGMSMTEAAAAAGRSRFRAVILTSSTTIAGLLPLLAEGSLQAQVLKPIVISTVFGLFASTVLVLLVIPCVYTILNDLGAVASPGEE